jgi:putative nucleotidyltransferase with HDIG domain
MLRLAGIAGMPEAIIDSAVLNWQINLAAQCFSTCKPIMVDDLSRDNHPGAQALYQEAGYLTCAALPLQARGQAKGVLQFYNRAEIAARDGGDWKDFLHSLSLQTAIGMDHVEMMENLKRSNRELAMAYDETIKGWAQALELRDQETRGHADRVSDLTVRLAANLGFKGEALDHIRRGALLHDIGKMAIQDRILNKTGPLTSEEWVTMRQHTTIAYNMLYNIEYLRPALDVVYAHHEKWDGTGYPRGLKGEEIPLSARIFAVVDVWDAITNPRPYRNLPWPVSEARAYIIQQSGKHFDPRVVEEFIKLIG